MGKISNFLHWLTAAATVLVTALLCHQCIDIYCTGNRPENIANGVYLTPVFSAEIVADRLLRLAPVLLLYVLLVAAGLLLRSKESRDTQKFPAPRPVRYSFLPNTKPLRLILAVLAIAFLILGVKNGGARDVFVKAVNICTECIGLG